jgi:hypothetical protein
VWDPTTLWHRAQCVREAYTTGLLLAPQAIYRETSYELRELLKGLLPALLTMLVVMAASTALGGAAGAAVGALFGGVGAVPGAALGAQAGMDLGLAILTWLGLAFLAASIARGLGPLAGRVEHAVQLAWNAFGTPQQHTHVQAAGRELAQAIAELMKLVLMGIVVYLTKDAALAATTRSGGSLAELVAALRKSRMGVGFAEWVETNAQGLLRNPKLRPQQASGGSAAAQESVTPSQLTREAAPPATPPPAAPAAPKAKPVSARERYMGRTPGKGSRTGRQVMDRMKSESTLRESVMDDGMEFQASNGNWYPLSEGDMAHKVDAVSWWNETGRQFGPKSPEVRAFMLDADNYTLDHYSINRSLGAKLGQTYLPPTK